MTLLAISSEGPDVNDLVDPRFGRAAGFILMELDGSGLRYVDNSSAQVLGQGAGIQAAETIVNEGVGIVLTGHVGPKAAAALEKCNVKAFEGFEGVTVQQAFDRYLREHGGKAEQ